MDSKWIGWMSQARTAQTWSQGVESCSSQDWLKWSWPSIIWARVPLGAYKFKWKDVQTTSLIKWIQLGSTVSWVCLGESVDKSVTRPTGGRLVVATSSRKDKMEAFASHENICFLLHCNLPRVVARLCCNRYSM